jgi:hypothetical protein
VRQHQNKHKHGIVCFSRQGVRDVYWVQKLSKLLVGFNMDGTEPACSIYSAYRASSGEYTSYQAIKLHMA